MSDREGLILASFAVFTVMMFCAGVGVGQEGVSDLKAEIATLNAEIQNNEYQINQCRLMYRNL